MYTVTSVRVTLQFTQIVNSQRPTHEAHICHCLWTNSSCKRDLAYSCQNSCSFGIFSVLFHYEHHEFPYRNINISISQDIRRSLLTLGHICQLPSSASVMKENSDNIFAPLYSVQWLRVIHLKLSHYITTLEAPSGIVTSILLQRAKRGDKRTR